MRDLPVFCVTVSTQTGETWKRYFIGRPVKSEVTEALQDAYLNTRANVDPEDEGARRLIASRFANLQKLVEEFWEPDKNIVVCTFAGVTVGNIRITRHSHAVVTQGIDLT